MVGYKVVITTSGLGSRLGNLTDYTNKSLVRVGDKPVISYIVESYPFDTEFIITLGYFGSHVKQFLQLAYPDRNFTFVEINKYRGEGSSLGYSLLQCKHSIDKPFIFHASDTIIKELTIPPIYQNWVMGSYKEESSQYRTLNIRDGKLIKVNEKGEIGFDFSYVGIAGIRDFELFFCELERLVYSNYVDISDVHVINSMLPEVNFYYKHIDYGNWFDIGNTSELAKTRKSLTGTIEVLEKKDESIFFFKDFVIKFFADSTTNKNRVGRAKNLKKLVPDIIDSTENFYKYEKVEGKLFANSVNRAKFITFLDWSQQNLWVRKTDNSFKEKCYDFYITKTKKRVSEYLKIYPEVNSINEELTPTVYDLIDSIDLEWLCNGIPSQFHGDFILDNIIETSEGFKLIDWRQDFAGNLEIGDIYYDLAKLNHNLVVNHDIANKSLFKSSPEDCYILMNSKLNECRELLYEFIQKGGYDLQKVKILTSIIWINMAPLHEYPFSNFLFNFGKYHLHKNLKL